MAFESHRCFLSCVILLLSGYPQRGYAIEGLVKPSQDTKDKVVKPTADSPNNTGPTSPDRVLPGEAPKRKNYWVPALEIPAFLLALNGVDRVLYPSTVYNSGYQSTKDFFLHQPWVYDQDPFQINQAFHPYQGATMFGFARSSGLNFWESLGYANAGSFMWKMADETDNPSINDQVTTGQAGSILGEEIYRMASLISERGGNDPETWREWSAAVISPPPRA